MTDKKLSKPVFLPGADPEKDCQTVDEGGGPVTAVVPDDHEHDITWRDVDANPVPSAASVDHWLPRRARWSQVLERLALAVEGPANKLIGTTQLNPFYHTGTLAVLLLAVVGLTGFYLFLFYQYGFDASYNAVLTRIETPFIARTMRAIHRYASGALVITTLLHAFRTLFMERFRGPRWLAWVTGIAMTALLWLAGVTGYWLIWDERAQAINDSFINFLGAVTPWAADYMVTITRMAATESWPLFLAVFAVHVLLFLIVAGFFYLHIKRLSRPKWLPPAFLVVGVAAVLLLVSIFLPAGMLPQGSLTELPGRVTIDPLFLFYLPVSGRPPWNGLLWGGLLLLTAVLTALPWLRRLRAAPAPGAMTAPASISLAPPLVNIMKERCTGCTVCAVDCPYGAIEMVERHDGKRHKYIAIEDPSLCVSCGICVGSCDGVAVTLGDTNPALLWDSVAARLTLARVRAPGAELTVVFTCERHALHGARPYLDHSAAVVAGTAVEVVPLPCVGSAPPDLLARTLEQGAANVRVIGCPPDDCANREGNLWLEQRLTRERVPRLKRPYANAPITASWLAPDDFARGLKPHLPDEADLEEGEQLYLAQRRMLQPLEWRNYTVAFVLLALVLLLQVLLTDLPFMPSAGIEALNRVVVQDLGAPLQRGSYLSAMLGPTLDLTLELDGQVAHQERVTTADILAAESFPYFHEQPLTAGAHMLRLTLRDPQTGTVFVLYNQDHVLAEGDILTIPAPSGS